MKLLVQILTTTIDGDAVTVDGEVNDVPVQVNVWQSHLDNPKYCADLAAQQAYIREELIAAYLRTAVRDMPTLADAAPVEVVVTAEEMKERGW